MVLDLQLDFFSVSPSSRYLLLHLSSAFEVLLNKFRSFPPLFENTPNAVQELTLAREIYEHTVVLSVKVEDQEAFERDFFQLKPYYTDARDFLAHFLSRVQS